VVILALLWMLACVPKSVIAPEPAGPLAFPADHGVHARAQTEWWYLQGVVHTVEGRRLGVFLSSVRHDVRRDRAAGVPVPWFGGDAVLMMACVADLDTGERISEKQAVGAVPSPISRLRHAEDWLSLRMGRFRQWGGGGRVTWDVPTKLGRLRIHMVPDSDPMPIGSREGPGSPSTGRTDVPSASFSYYVQPRVRLMGELDGQPIVGDGWFEQQWGTMLSRDYMGWWWASLMLDDGTDVLAVRAQGRGGAPDFALATIRPQGEPARQAQAFTLEATGWRTSDRTGVDYPDGLALVVPELALDLTVRPERPEAVWKVLPAPLWEGPVQVEGTRGGAPIGGWGFTEFLLEGDLRGRDLYRSGGDRLRDEAAAER
jgi:predicted secreted hydrolase